MIPGPTENQYLAGVPNTFDAALLRATLGFFGLADSASVLGDCGAIPFVLKTGTIAIPASPHAVTSLGLLPGWMAY
jgi:hypothetical protein